MLQAPVDGGAFAVIASRDLAGALARAAREGRSIAAIASAESPVSSASHDPSAPADASADGTALEPGSRAYRVRWSSAARAQRLVIAEPSRVERRLAELAREGFEPVLVALSSGEEGAAAPLEVVVVAEASSALGAPNAPGASWAPGAPTSWGRRLVGPLPFVDDDGRLFYHHAPRPHDRGHVASIAVAGQAHDASGAGLVAAFVWALDGAVRTSWGVHWHASTGAAFDADPTVAVLAEQGGLVHRQEVVGPSTSGTVSLWHAVAPSRSRSAVAPIEASPDAPAEAAADPIDTWMGDHMARLGADAAQIVVVREGALALLRSYGAASGLDRPMRLGSVSKVVLALATAGALRRAGFVQGWATTIGELGVVAPQAAPRLLRTTVGQLLTHTAGLRTAAEILHDDPRHPLAEARVARDLGRVDATLRPGDLLHWFERDPDAAVFAREPGTGRPDYGNEGAILLGEVLARLTLGPEASFSDVVTRMFAAAGVDLGPRGCLFAAGLARSIARGEVPPRSTAISWAPSRFDPDRAAVPPPFADPGPYLGGAAGLSLPLAKLGAAWCAMAREGGDVAGHRSGAPPDPWCPTQSDLARLTIPAPQDPRFGHGVMLGRPTYWTFRAPRGAARTVARTVRVRPVHHQGRLDGGSALFAHLVPIDPNEGAGLAWFVAFNRLGPLAFDEEGRGLMAILRDIEGRAGWGDDFALGGDAG